LSLDIALRGEEGVKSAIKVGLDHLPLRAPDILGDNPTYRGGVQGPPGRVGQAGPDGVLGKARALSRCRDRYFVVVDGASQLLAE
jgi:hypothetical protein